MRESLKKLSPYKLGRVVPEYKYDSKELEPHLEKIALATTKAIAHADAAGKFGAHPGDMFDLQKESSRHGRFGESKEISMTQLVEDLEKGDLISFKEKFKAILHESSAKKVKMYSKKKKKKMKAGK